MVRSRTRPFALERSFTHRLHTLHKLTDRVTLQAYQDDAGMALGEGRCLSAVASFGPLSVKDLAGWANLDKGQASRAAQALAEQGLVRKDAHARDGRGVVLALTPKGERTWHALREVIARRNDEILGCLSAAEQRQLDSMLDRLVEHARACLHDDGAD